LVEQIIIETDEGGQPLARVRYLFAAFPEWLIENAVTEHYRPSLSVSVPTEATPPRSGWPAL
jgi:stringent starvation protein B